MKLIAALLFLWLACGAQRSVAPQAAVSTATIWGGNTNVVVQWSKPVRLIKGIVETSAGAPLAGVLVEIYDHPEVVLRDPSSSRTGQKRITGVLTDQAGRFLFELPDGDYEIRASKSSEFDVTSVVVHLRKSVASSRARLKVKLLLGQ